MDVSGKVAGSFVTKNVAGVEDNGMLASVGVVDSLNEQPTEPEPSITSPQFPASSVVWLNNLSTKPHI